jgi:hypothetical protein
MMDFYHKITTYVDDAGTADSLDMTSLRLDRIPHGQRDIPWPPVSFRKGYEADPVKHANDMAVFDRASAALLDATRQYSFHPVHDCGRPQ